ncbi:MAG: DUF3465 domain-containing protein [Sulfurimonas sp.]|jgi:hypothetical protein|uniref:DUF3465 domain-containing protein n=1 Tax=Sulfurimonas sp. TaxID=2022749 RepID=UPI002615D53F|nr:DUF3465 domain-containing protein [Sulfurimonas sp.]MDD3475408.1 DUF3465 domain-containing protein [Sulfurimonas sp.]
MKKILFILVALSIFYQQNLPLHAIDADSIISDAFKSHRSNLQVSGEGIVTKLLADDNDGSRHQRFLIKLSMGHTLLIAHNIDLAPRISFIRQGERVEFYGEYEWNKKGGVIHWTHKDPRGSHTAGWIKHNGRTYQ